jgi:hypothetical protein
VSARQSARTQRIAEFITPGRVERRDPLGQHVAVDRLQGCIFWRFPWQKDVESSAAARRAG